jgi:hypothetical protein
MAYILMPSRVSTLLREDAIDLGRPKLNHEAKKQAIRDAEKIQNQILYCGDPTLFKTCIICNTKLEGKRNDHFVSAIKDKSARFRDGKMLVIAHPLNKVYCCKGCNNEQCKMKRIHEAKRLKDYYEYVLNHCPTNDITEEEWETHARLTKEAEEKRMERVDALHNKLR